jgi:hypothetical protein
MSNKLRNYIQVLISKNLLEAIMRVVLASMFLLTFGTNGAFAWRCGEPGAPPCPDGLCTHDLTLKSDYCQRGLVLINTPAGPAISATSSEGRAALRRLREK